MTRVFREALVALWRTGTVGLVSVVAVAASLLLVGLFVQVLDAAQGLSASIKDRVEVEAYLKEGVTRAAAIWRCRGRRRQAQRSAAARRAGLWAGKPQLGPHHARGGSSTEPRLNLRG